MSDVKTIEQWEREKGWLVTRPDVNPQQKLSEEDFDAIPHNEKTGVNYEDRIKFLKANGYEVNRQNLGDSSLSHKEPDNE